MIAHAILRSLVEAAALAPSKLNTQPWKFAIGLDAVRIFPDHGRSLRVVDPEDRELFMSMGAAAENLMVAARHVGLSPTLELFPDDEIDYCLRVRLSEGMEVGDPLFAGLELRSTNRALYDGRPLTAAELETIRAVPCEPGVGLELLTDRARISAVSALVQRADVLQYTDPDFREELGRWVRFTEREAEKHHDGLTAEQLGLHGHLPHWVGEAGLRMDARAQKQAHRDAERIESASGLLVLATEAEGRKSWVAAGRTLERLALQLALHGLAASHLDQPCEVSEMRGLLRDAAGLGSRFPQAVLRVGHAAPTTRTKRRPLEELVIEEPGQGATV